MQIFFFSNLLWNLTKNDKIDDKNNWVSVQELYHRLFLWEFLKNSDFIQTSLVHCIELTVKIWYWLHNRLKWDYRLRLKISIDPSCWETKRMQAGVHPTLHQKLWLGSFKIHKDITLEMSWIKKNDRSQKSC